MSLSRVFTFFEQLGPTFYIIKLEKAAQGVAQVAAYARSCRRCVATY